MSLPDEISNDVKLMGKRKEIPFAYAFVRIDPDSDNMDCASMRDFADNVLDAFIKSVPEVKDILVKTEIEQMDRYTNRIKLTFCRLESKEQYTSRIDREIEALQKLKTQFPE